MAQEISSLFSFLNSHLSFYNNNNNNKLSGGQSNSTLPYSQYEQWLDVLTHYFKDIHSNSSNSSNPSIYSNSYNPSNSSSFIPDPITKENIPYSSIHSNQSIQSSLQNRELKKDFQKIKKKNEWLF